MIGVLGPVTAWDASGAEIPLKGPRHRAVLARLVVARGRAVSLDLLIDDVWADPPADPVGAIRTFVGDLRRALEPDRPPRARPRLLVTAGTGYALKLTPHQLDATRFEEDLRAARTLAPAAALLRLEPALAFWRGPAYAELTDAWVRPEQSRLNELRLQAIELRAQVQLRLGRAGEVIADLDAHVLQHPWREEGWRMLATALRDTGRQAEALDVLRRARGLLVDQLGLDPGRALQDLELNILRQEPGEPGRAGLGGVWGRAAEAYRQVAGAGGRTHLRSTVDLLKNLAVTGGPGLVAARTQRLDTIHAAEALGDVELTARIIGSYDVPAIWTRSDDPAQARQVVAAAERTLSRLPETSTVLRARLLATIAIESRGTADPRPRAAALEAEQLARSADDPALLAFALNGVFLQTFHRTGLARDRDAIGAELIALATKHGLTTYEILGHLIRLQSHTALADLATADRHAAAVDTLSDEYEAPLARVFTRWYRAVRLAMTGAPADQVADAYRAAAHDLEDSGMPGMSHGLLPLALLSLHLIHNHPLPPDLTHSLPLDLDWGPYLPWVRPLLAADPEALRAVPDPPHDHLAEALWCVIHETAIRLGDAPTQARARAALLPAAHEHAAGSATLTLGPIQRLLASRPRRRSGKVEP